MFSPIAAAAIATLLQTTFAAVGFSEASSLNDTRTLSFVRDEKLDIFLLTERSVKEQAPKTGDSSLSLTSLEAIHATGDNKIAVVVLQVAQKKTNGGTTVYSPVQDNDEQVISILRKLSAEVIVVPWNFLKDISIDRATFIWVVHAASNSFSKDMTDFLLAEKRPAIICDPTVQENLGLVGSKSELQYGSVDATKIQYVGEDGSVTKTADLSSNPLILNWGFPASNSLVAVRNPDEPAQAYVYAFPPGTVNIGSGTRVGCPLHKPEGNQNRLKDADQAELSALIDRMVDLAFSPGTAQVYIALNASNLLFTSTDEVQYIRAAVTDQFGTVYDISNYNVEWVSTTADISISVISADLIKVQSTVMVGYSIIVARSKNNPSMISEPVSAVAAKLKADVTAIGSDDMLYPLPPILPDDSLEGVEGYEITSSGIVVGGFPISDIFDSYSVQSENGISNTFSPIVVRTSLLQSNPSIIVSKRDVGISGRITSKTEKGTWTLVIVEAVFPTDLFLELKVKLDGPALVSQGLYPKTFKPADSSRFIEPNGGDVRQNIRFLNGSRQGLPGSETPPYLRRFNKDRCVLSGSANVISISLDSIEIKPQRVPPIGEIELSENEKPYFFVYGGVEVEVQYRPEINIQATAMVELDCAIGPELSQEFGLSAATLSLFDIVGRLQAGFLASVESSYGSRINAFALFRTSTKITAGFRYEDGRFWKEDNDVGEYLSFTPPKFQLGPVDTGLTFGGGFIGNQEQVDAAVDAKAGPYLKAKFDFQLGGAILNRLTMILRRAGRTTDSIARVVESLNKLGVVQFLQGFRVLSLPAPSDSVIARGQRAIDFLGDVTSITFVELKIPLQLALRYETARHILNEADAGNWLANEHQSFSVETDLSLTLGLTEIERFFKKIFNVEFNLAITLKRPPQELLYFYKGIQGAGNIQHTVEKGSENSGGSLEQGDRIFFRVPGTYGSYAGFDFSSASDNRPRFCTVYTESVFSFDRVAELDYKGIQNDLHICEGYVDIDDSSLASYLNDDKELFFLIWNKFKAVDVTGYLNSASEFTLTSVNLEAEEEVSVAAEVDKTAQTGINVINKSQKLQELVAVQFTATTSIPGLTITPSSGTFAANSNNPLQLEYQCDEEAKFDGTVTVTGSLNDGENTIMGDVEVKVKIECLDVECPLGAIPNPGGATVCACDSYNGWIVIPNTNTCQCDANRGFTLNANLEECDSCGEKDASKPYYNTETRQCEACPFGAIVNPTGVTPCACDSSRGFFIVSPDSRNPDSCECKEETPRYNPSTDICEACPVDRPKYNPTTTLCEKDCTDPAMPFFNPATLQCEACPSQTPTYNSDLGICEAACPGGTRAGNNEPFYGGFQLGATSGVFSFSRTHYTIKDRMQVIYEGRILHDTGCTGGSQTVPLSYAGSSTFVIVRVIPNCAGTTGTAWTFTVSCPS